MSKKDKNKKKRGLKFWLPISVSGSLFLITVLFVMWFVLLRDPNRSTHVRSNNTYQDIVKRSFIKGFENTENTGKFTYILTENDVNDLLADGAKNLNDEHIETIYTELTTDGGRMFYVDLKNTFIKSRVAIKTSVNEYGNGLKIVKATIGKVNVTRYLEKKGYLEEYYLTQFFSKASRLGGMYRGELKTIYFYNGPNWSIIPESKICDNFTNNSVNNKTDKNPLDWSYTVDYSLQRINSNLNYQEAVGSLPDFYNELKSACESEYAGMSFRETKTVYSITEDDFRLLLKTNFDESFKETLFDQIDFDLVDAQPAFKEDKVEVSFLYSLNGYLVDRVIDLNFLDMSSNTFNTAIELSYEDKFASEYAEEIFKNIKENHANLFNFNSQQGMFYINSSSMNSTFVDINLQNAPKFIELNPTTKTIDFKITKAV